MPKLQGVYRADNGSWYFKATLGRDPLSGKRLQVTKRGFPTATDASRARRDLLEQADDRGLPTVEGSMTVDELLDLYLDGIDADGRLSPKTRYDYRRNADAYVRPWLGRHRVRALTPEVVLAWQRQLSAGTGTKRGKPLAPNTVRLARASLAGAVGLAVKLGLLRTNPLTSVPRPKARRSTPWHWSPEQARAFLASQAGDRLYPLWAFLLCSGLRIGELVWLRWPNVDLDRRRVRIVEFATSLGWDLVASDGKSVTSRRIIDLDDSLVQVLRAQAHQQRFEARAPGYEATEYVFTKPAGGSYHPQHLSKTLADLSVAAGLPRLTAHGLRHTSATLMLDQGVAPKVAAERLGHADPTLFVNLYSHVTPTMQRDAADAIGAALFGDEDAAAG
ncbi:MAG: site-specific integrase [Acidimicrobiales bacterium]|nr:site-specific integrase [Acidimicrobiales bacterium]